VFIKRSTAGRRIIVRQQSDNSSKCNVVWFIIGFIIPVLGIVLTFLFWKTRHYNAVACLWGVGVSLAIGMLFPSYDFIEFY
jgi:hypothetical protein